MTLFELTTEQLALEAQLEETGGELTPEIEARMAETAEAFPKKIDGYGTMLRKFAAAEKMCDDEIKRVQGLKKVAQNAQKSIRRHLLDTMTFFKIKKLDGVTTKMWTGTSTALEVDEVELLKAHEAKINELRAKLPPYLSIEVKVNKTEIKNGYKATGTLPAGCKMVENDTLTVR